MKKIFPFLIILISLFLVSCNISNNEQKNINKSKYEIIATWINYFEIKEIVIKSNSQSQFEDNVYNIVLKLKEFKINTIFLQVRAFDDAFYVSDICGASNYCKDENNNLKFDVLATFINICKKENINVHAWINPYRIRNDNDISKINFNSYSSSIIKNNSCDERIIITDSNIYYNPAYLDNQNYILDCVKEIILKYDIKGIHIDDYFYPTTSTEIDKEIYKSYIDGGGTLSLFDYRRNCINSFVSSMYQIVSNQNNLLFTISPCGDINKNYNELYADVEYWVQNNGFVDYIIPQLYYGFDNTIISYTEAFNDWIKIRNITNKIIIGLQFYKSGNKDSYAGNGEMEWIINDDIILRQIKYSESFSIAGYAFYSSSFLYCDDNNTNIKAEKNNLLLYFTENW